MLQKCHHLESSHWKSTKNESRDRFPLSRCTLESHVPSVFTTELYSPCLLWGRSIIGTIRQATAQWAPSVGEGTEKKHKKSMVHNKHLSEKKTWKNSFAVFIFFFFRVVFFPYMDFCPNLSDVMKQVCKFLFIHLLDIHLGNVQWKRWYLWTWRLKVIGQLKVWQPIVFQGLFPRNSKNRMDGNGERSLASLNCQNHSFADKENMNII